MGKPRRGELKMAVKLERERVVPLKKLSTFLGTMLFRSIEAKENRQTREKSWEIKVLSEAYDEMYMIKMDHEPSLRPSKNQEVDFTDAVYTFRASPKGSGQFMTAEIIDVITAGEMTLVGVNPVTGEIMDKKEDENKTNGILNNGIKK